MRGSALVEACHRYRGAVIRDPSTDLDDPATDPTDLARLAAEEIAAATGSDRHDIVLVAGSGWAEAMATVGECVAELPAAEITGFAPSAVPGHRGVIRSVLVRAGPAVDDDAAAVRDGGIDAAADRDAAPVRRVLVLGCRSHLYEGRGVRAVAHGVRTAAAAGCSVAVLTNGCGSIDVSWPPGTLVLIGDHINLTGASPLEGPRFLDLSEAYASRLRALCRTVDPSLPEGVYVQFRGPAFETPAEVRMAAALGGHLVGMSTALETVAAREAGLDVLGLSLVTNPAAGVTSAPLHHTEVLAAGRSAADRLADFLARVLPLL